MKSIAFFNNKGGVGNTALAYHLAWMFAELGKRVIVADLDPQSNLSSMFLDEDRLEELWPAGKHPETIQGVLDPIVRGIGDIVAPHIENISNELGLIVGDLGLSKFEDKLSEAWPRCHNRDEAAFRTMTAFHRAMLGASDQWRADFVLIDVGPNLGAINRSALIAADHVVIPLAPDLFSLQGLRNLGPQLREWRASWAELRSKSPDPELPLPKGNMVPLGYVLMQHAARQDRPVRAYQRWIARIPEEYSVSVLNSESRSEDHGLATLKHYRSLMPLAMEARKPMFFLKPSDGAIGAHGTAVRDCYRDFQVLAQRIVADISLDEKTTTLPPARL
jgi:cellulose biosynthesis protein BcsQ